PRHLRAPRAGGVGRRGPDDAPRGGPPARRVLPRLLVRRAAGLLHADRPRPAGGARAADPAVRAQAHPRLRRERLAAGIAGPDPSAHRNDESRPEGAALALSRPPAGLLSESPL